MFCNNCGNELQGNQAICPRCSAPVLGRYVQPNRIERHLTVLGILWIAYGVLHVGGGLAMFFVRMFVFGGVWSPPGAPFFVGTILHAVTVFLLVTGFVGLFAGIGLMRAELWARPLIIGLAILSLLNVPFGTALGIYTLWALVGGNSATEYERMSAARA
ncbi:MAG: zinc ribbon domain-containing protein [Acidobacteria bacterium]|nr:zinc ribbon domain-containing protein [Acidobacteriota bacterium]